MKNYYGQGYTDGVQNKPRAKGLKGHNKACYENGYREGQAYRTLEGTRKKEKQ